MAALMGAPSPLPNFLFVLLVVFVCFVCATVSLIQYDQQTLLDIRSSLGKDYFTNFHSTFRSTSSDCSGLFVVPPLCLPTRRRRKKRGRRAGVLVRTRKRYFKPTLPTILLANVQSIDNKMDDLNARTKFQRDITNCCVLAFVETWLVPEIPDTAVTPSGFNIFRQDRTADSGKCRGGGVCVMVNFLWATDIAVLASHCSPVLELLTVKIRPFYLPREFTAVIMTVVYIPPQVDKAAALDELYGIINGLENVHPEAAFIVVGDFNRANLKKVLPKYHQHIDFPTRGDQTLDHCYTAFRGSYKPLPRPAFGKADHTSILLLPAYKQKLKQVRPVMRTVHQWCDESMEALQDCFDTTDWLMFREAADGDINEYTDTVTSYIHHCIDNMVPKRAVRSFPNQRPWVDTAVRASLRARSAAFNSGDPDQYRKARYDLLRAIKSAKRTYRTRVESSYHGSDPRRMWSGLQAITEYKGRGCSETQYSALQPDELNVFYARFEKTSDPPVVELPDDRDSGMPTLSVAEVRQCLKKVNPRKAPGPDGISGRALRGCADQLAGVFSDIFNLSLSLSVLPTCFKRTTIVPVPKFTKATSINDYRPIALTSVIMKCFERLVKSFICSSLPPTLDPMQFAYRSNRSTDDAIALTVHTALSHLEKGDSYVRMLFIDYSSAFNTIIPSRLVSKLVDLGLNTSLCKWIYSFLTGRPQVVRLGDRTSATVVTNTGTPQGCVLSPLLFSLFTHDCATTHSSNLIVKFADDTTIVGLITNSDETAYREEVDTLTTWCQENNLSLNISKTKEMIVDFRRRQGVEHAPLHINGSEVEKVSCFKFLGVNISHDLTWSAHTDKVVKAARKRLFFLRRLKKFGMNPVILTNFYRCTIESILTGSISVWFGSCTAMDRKALRSVVRSAECIIGRKLPTLQDIYHTRCLRRAGRILKDCHHPSFRLFTMLPSGRRYRSIRSRTRRMENSFYPKAIRLLNGL